MHDALRERLCCSDMAEAHSDGRGPQWWQRLTVDAEPLVGVHFQSVDLFLLNSLSFPHETLPPPPPPPPMFSSMLCLSYVWWIFYLHSQPMQSSEKNSARRRLSQLFRRKTKPLAVLKEPQSRPWCLDLLVLVRSTTECDVAICHVNLLPTMHTLYTCLHFLYWKSATQN